jgi:hypothetical protein
MKMETNLARSIASLAAFILLMGLSTSASANWGRDGVYVVKCDDGMNPQRILDMQWFARPIELQLVGICPGFGIKRDDVTVTARDNEACPGATVNGEISIDGARDVELSCIAVSGDEGGVQVFGGKAFLEDVHIFGSNDIGVEVRDGGSIEMIGGSITDSVLGVGLEHGFAQFEDVDISSNRGTAVSLEHNSYFEMGGGSISNNPGDGISVSSNSVLQLGDVTVANNGRHGVALYGGANATLDDVAIRENGGSGIYARKLVSVNIRGGSVANNSTGVSLNQHSFAFVTMARIESNRNSGLHLRFDSGALLWNGAYIHENPGPAPADVVCEGVESSVEIHSGADIGTVHCLHPDF